jgi:hypothetical protein
VNKSKRVAFTWDQEYKPYVELIKESLHGFGAKDSLTNTELFILFMCVGFDQGVRRKITGRVSDAARFEYITEMQMSLIKSVGLAEAESADLLLEEDELLTIPEEYAAGGLMLLASAYDSESNFSSWLKTKLVEYTKLTPASLVVEQ